MTHPKRNDDPINITKLDPMRILTEDDLIKALRQTLLQTVLETEMDKAFQAGKSGRTSGRPGYR